MSKSNNQSRIEPNLAQARNKSVMAHEILVKFQEMGLPDDMNDEVAKLATSLGDIWNAHLGITNSIKTLINDSVDWDSMGDSLTDIYTHLDHAEWHEKGIKELIFKISQYSYNNIDTNG